MGIDGKEDAPTKDIHLQAQLADPVVKAIEGALTLLAGPQSLGDIEIDGLALDAAESIMKQFDVLPKGELRQETKVRRMEINGGPELVRAHRQVTRWKRANQ